MKEIIKVEIPNFKASYEVVWYDNTDFSSLKDVKQVYGVLLNKNIFVYCLKNLSRFLTNSSVSLLDCKIIESFACFSIKER